MKYRLQIILILVFQLSVAQSQILIPKKDYVPEIRQARYSFALTLITGTNSELVSYGIIRQNPDSTHEIIYLTKDSFIRQASGLEASKANAEKINYFKEYKIDSKVLDDLWRLKFEINPYDTIEINGWGTKPGVPSPGQFELLRQFGIELLTDYFYGEKLWVFLTKVNDPLWTAAYQLRK